MSDDDPMVMYLIVRESLGMSPGKIGAQCGHAGQLATELYYEKILSMEGIGVFEARKTWRATSYRKIVKGADEKEWAKVKAAVEGDPLTVTVVDLGLSEVPANSETVIALWPMKRSATPKVVSKLQNLK